MGFFGIGRKMERELIGILDGFIVEEDQYREYLMFAKCMKQKTTRKSKKQDISELGLKGDVSAYQKVFDNLDRCQPTLEYIERVHRTIGETKRYSSIKAAIFKEADGAFDFYRDDYFLQVLEERECLESRVCFENNSPFRSENLHDIALFEISDLLYSSEDRSFATNAEAFSMGDSYLESSLRKER